MHDELTLEHPSLNVDTSTEDPRHSPYEGQDLGRNLPDVDQSWESRRGECREGDDGDGGKEQAEATGGHEGKQVLSSVSHEKPKTIGPVTAQAFSSLKVDA